MLSLGVIRGVRGVRLGERLARRFAVSVVVGAFDLGEMGALVRDRAAAYESAKE